MPLTPSLVAELRECHDLLRDDVITRAEFDQLKKGIIGKVARPSADPAAPATPVPPPAPATPAPDEVDLASPSAAHRTISNVSDSATPSTPITPSNHCRQPDLLSLKGIYHVSGQTIGEKTSGKRAVNKPKQRVEITKGRRRIVTTVHTPVFKCTRCGKKCKSKGALTNHMKTHGEAARNRGALGGGVRDYFGTSRARRAQAASGSATPSRIGKPTITGLGTVYPKVWNLLRKKKDRKKEERKRAKVQSGRGGEDRRNMNSGSKKRRRNNWAYKVCHLSLFSLLLCVFCVCFV